MTKRLKVLVWHIHGSYLNLLVRVRHDFFLPTKPGRPEGYGGKGPTFKWPDWVVEVPAEAVRTLELDVIIFQSPKNYLEDQYEILTDQQRRLPRIYLEHNSPRQHPTDTRHLVDDPEVLVVHCTHFNNLMWDCGHCSTRVIPHGAIPRPELKYQGDLERGIVVVNDLQRRGRICGCDLFQHVRRRVPLDLFGLNSQEIGGKGDLPQLDLLQQEVRYRFFFNPIRYTSHPLAVVEAMMLGMPIVALATTELSTTIDDGVNGFIANDLELLIDRMKLLLAEPGLAREMGERARRTAMDRFHIDRFIQDWDSVLQEVAAGGA